MRIFSLNLFLSVFCFIILSAPAVNGYSSSSGYGQLYANNTHKRSNDWMFLPSAGLLVDSGFYAENDAGYTMVIHRVLVLDVLRYRNVMLSFSVDEGMFFRDSGSNYTYPYLIYNQTDFINLQWELPQGSLSWFVDHTCNNIIDQDVAGSRRFRWYGTGLRWETQGMRLGRKGSNINTGASDNLELLNSFNYMVSAAKSLSTRYVNYKMLFKGALRYDLLRYYNLIPYAEGSFCAIVDDCLRLDRSLETGIRIHLQNVYLIPYVRYERRHDTDLNNMGATDLYFTGLRLETLLGVGSWERDAAAELPVVLPEIHFSGQYAHYVDDSYLYFNGDIFFELDLFRVENISLFLNNRLSQSSSSKSRALYPRYLQYTVESGLSFWLRNGILIEPFYHYDRRDEGNYYRGYNEQYQLTGLRLKSTGMKTGYCNHGIGFNGSEWLNRINWLVSAGMVVQKNNFNYDRVYQLQLRWDIYRYRMIIPYVSAGVQLFHNDEALWQYSTESGLRMHFGLDLMFFYRYYYRTEADLANGIDGRYHLIGFRVEM